MLAPAPKHAGAVDVSDVSAVPDPPPLIERPKSWWPDVAMLSVLAVVTSLLLWPSPVVVFEVAVRDFALAHQVSWVATLAHLATFLGQGTPLALIVLALAAALARRTRSVRPLFMFAATYAALGVMLGLKSMLDRVAPRFPDGDATVGENGAVLLSHAEPAMSYPSGHGANVVVWYVLAIVFAGEFFTKWQRACLLFIPSALVIVSQTYLAYHWVVDTPAGMILGVLILRMVARVPWHRSGLRLLRPLEPASGKDVASMTVILAALVGAMALPAYRYVAAAVVCVVGFVWLFLRLRVRPSQ